MGPHRYFFYPFVVLVCSASSQTGNSKIVANCIESFRSLNNGTVAIANTATPDVSYLALYADPAGFSADIGNYDFCMRQELLTHCVAGSVPLDSDFATLAPYAGLCVPKSCSPSALESVDLRSFLRESIASMLYTDSNQLTRGDSTKLLSTDAGQQKYSYFVKLQNILAFSDGMKSGFSCGDHVATMTIDRYIFFTLFALLVVTVMFCTAYHMSTTGWSFENLRVVGEKKSTGSKIVEAFSLVKNIPYIFSAPKTSATFAVLDGFRAISMLWIMLGHTFTTATSFGVLNPASILAPNGFLKDISAQIFFSARFSVDTFFFISGFLVALSLLKRLSPTERDKPSYDTFSEARNNRNKREESKTFLRKSFDMGMMSASIDSTLPNKGSESDADLVGLVSDGSQYQHVSQEAPSMDIDENPGLQEGKGSRTKQEPATQPTRASTSQRPTTFLSMCGWLPAFYMHRLIRILPLYAFCILVWWKVAIMLGSGPYWNRWQYFTHQCDEYWWTNFLFINNVHPYIAVETSECYTISWYLAVDMQFYLIAPFFVVLYLKSEHWGLWITALVCALSCAGAMYGTIEGDWSAHSFDGLWVTKYAVLFYTKPHFRLPPYCIGMLAAMVWHQKCMYYPDYKVPVNLARFALTAAVATIFYLIFGAASAYQKPPCGYFEPSTDKCGSNWPLTSRVLYNSLTKPAWSIAVAVITLLSGNDQGASVQTFLSHGLFGPPAKVTFAVYLLHYTILNIWYLSRTQKLSYSAIDFAISYCAVVFVSFALGLFVTVLIESPSSNLGSALEKWLYSAHSAEPRSVEKVNSVELGNLKDPVVSFEKQALDSQRTDFSSGVAPGAAGTGQSAATERTRLLVPTK